MTLDENVEMVQKTAEKLLARHGRLEGLVRHLQTMDRQRERIRKRKPQRKTRGEKGGAKRVK